MVTTAPCLKELLTKSSYVIKSEKLRYIAFENIDCIIEKHPEACNYILKELCIRKPNSLPLKQFLVTSRTWNPVLNTFLNPKNTRDPALIIGNYLESAYCAGVSLNFILCNSEVKLENLTGTYRFLFWWSWICLIAL